MREYRDPETLRYLYLSCGHTLREIGEILGVSHATIARWLNRHSVPRRPTGFIPLVTKDDIEEIRRLRQEGQTLASIGRRYGISRQAVFLRLKKADSDPT